MGKYFFVMADHPFRTQIKYLGHSTLLIRARSTTILTDPVLRSRVTFLRRSSPLADHADWHSANVVLISHLHFDHLDFPTLRKLDGSQSFLIPRGAAPLLAKAGFRNYREVEVGEIVQVGEVSIRVTSAQHTRSRYPGGPQADCVGFVINGDHSVYYPGDTRLFPGMESIADELDIAFLPVWGWGPDKGKEHMGPIEAAQSLTLLKPKFAVPIHWGTYLPLGLHWLKPAFHFFPPHEFLRQARELAPQVDVRILQPGEDIVLEN
jgi:L-ascorbate metabolism protein UlaG (beta-lactamase superfamily)